MQCFVRFQPVLQLSPECRLLLRMPYFRSLTAYLFDDFARVLGTQDSVVAAEVCQYMVARAQYCFASLVCILAHLDE